MAPKKKRKKKQREPGRPRVFNRVKVLEQFRLEMAKGTRNMEQICSDRGMPSPESIFLWVQDDEQLLKIFMRAQELWCLAQRDITISIADDESRDYYDIETTRKLKDGTEVTTRSKQSDNTAVNRDSLRIRARHWAMEKLAPKLFGAKVVQEQVGPGGGPIQYEELVDKPPKETPEQWQERVQRQLAERAKQQREE